MRKIALLVLATAGLGLSQAASAADLGTAPLYRKAPPVETYSWTGAYIGGFVGGAFGAGDATTTTPVDNAGTPLFASPAATYDLGSSFIGGMTDGYNWQVAPNWVIGYESETGYINLKGSGAYAGSPTSGAITEATGTYSAWTGRLGYTWDRSMIYAKGGVALARFDVGAFDPTAGAHFDTRSHRYEWGYAIGGGWEYMFAPKWTIKAAYLYLGFDRDRSTTGNLNGNVTQLWTTTSVPGIHTAKVGINYKWDWMTLLPAQLRPF
jgi:outer membrane immunogenic protein